MPADLSIARSRSRRRPRRLAPARSPRSLAGAVSVLAMPPFFLWPVLWITLPVAGVADRWAASPRRRARRAARWYARPAVAAAEVGWWFGFGYFLAGLFWIGEAFLVEAERFACLMPVCRHC